ncbi:MSMEG_6728 family protein [Nakamurella sp. GG22]
MQTFLPYADFAASIAVLDTARLGKQRVETLQILRALTLPEYGWRNHPAVRMWCGRVDALALYGLISVAHWRERGFPDTTGPQIAEFAPEVVGIGQDDLAAAGRLPGWLGDERLHRSHRSKLLGKNPLHYGRYFTDVPDDLDYFWPEPDPGDAAVDSAVDSAVPDGSAVGGRLWVVRPESPEALGVFLDEGVVALGSVSGVTVDASGLDLAGLRQLATPPGRRVTRPLLALSRLLTEINVGDEVAVLIDGGARLLTGTVLGDYEFGPAGGMSTIHRRRVRWNRVIDRSAVTPPAALQDVRPVFDVRLGAPNAR